MKFVLQWILLLPLCMLMGSTQAQSDPTVLDKVAHAFQTQFNQANYAAIYSASAPGMKAAIELDEFEKTMRSVKTILGNIVQYDLSAIIPAKSAVGDDLLMLTYRTRFEHGVGEQVYFLQPQSAEFLLYQWNINSDDLIKGMVNTINP